MVKLTREQRLSLKRIYDRCPLYKLAADPPPYSIPSNGPITYREFRKLVTPYFDNSGCIMVQWCGMWIGIEVDGYAHS